MWMRVVDYVCSKQVSGYDSSATATRFPLGRGTIGRLAPLRTLVGRGKVCARKVSALFFLRSRFSTCCCGAGPDCSLPPPEPPPCAPSAFAVLVLLVGGGKQRRDRAKLHGRLHHLLLHLLHSQMPRLRVIRLSAP